MRTASRATARAVRDENSNWRIYEAVTREIPEEAVRCVLQIFVRKGSSGKVAFDNVAIWPRVRAAVQFMSSSAYRDTAERGTVRFHVSLCPPDGVKAPSARFAYSGSDGRLHKVVPTRLTDDEAMLELPVAKLALGTRDVRLLRQRCPARFGDERLYACQETARAPRGD